MIRLIAMMFEGDCVKFNVLLTYMSLPESDPATDMVLRSVRRTGRLVVVHEDNHTAGFGAEEHVGDLDPQQRLIGAAGSARRLAVVRTLMLDKAGAIPKVTGLTIERQGAEPEVGDRHHLHQDP